MSVETDMFRTLVDYHYWANDLLLQKVGSLTDEQFSRDLGSSFPSIQATLAHMMNAEAIWLTRILGRPVAGVTAGDLPDAGSVRPRWAPLEAELRSLIHQLTEADLARDVTAKTSAGKVYVNRLDQTLQHLFNHGTYHRGQVSAMLRQVGAESVSTDLIFYYRQGQ